MTEPSFTHCKAAPPASPVVISVPHAGRVYPAPLRAALRLPLAALTALEDRYVDVVAAAARTGEAMVVQQLGRAWIDLNRSEDERDPRVDEGAPASPASLSAKLKSGLGLVPRRAGSGDLWRRRFSGPEVWARIRDDYRPYHHAVAEALVAARARFGVAVLLDLHSMPSLGRGQPQVVIGDRFGRAAAPRFVARVEAVAVAMGHRTALNAPYAGSYILDRHGAPAANVHALQIELDRSLYLDMRLDQPGAGLDGTGRLVRDMLAALADEALAGEALGDPAALAAE